MRLLSSPRVDASISEKQKSKYMRFSEVVGSDVCKREQGASGHGYTVFQSAQKELWRTVPCLMLVEPCSKHGLFGVICNMIKVGRRTTVWLTTFKGATSLTLNNWYQVVFYFMPLQPLQNPCGRNDLSSWAQVQPLCLFSVLDEFTTVMLFRP